MEIFARAGCDDVASARVTRVGNKVASSCFFRSPFFPSRDVCRCDSGLSVACYRALCNLVLLLFLAAGRVVLLCCLHAVLIPLSRPVSHH